MPVGFVEDMTRSGKAKRRLANTQQKRTFTVKFRFDMTEYSYFVSWYNNDIRKGLFSFGFPQIDSTGTTIKEYRISANGSPKVSNPSGDMVDVTMEWEEV